MSRYVNLTSRGALGRSAGEKCDGILADGGKEIRSPKQFQPNLVCVIDKGFFGAATYVCSEREMKEHQQATDGYQRRWFIWNNVENFAE